MNFDVIKISKLTMLMLDLLLLDDNGHMESLPAETIQSGVLLEDLRGWCHYRARYGIPTLELIQWLKEKIAGRTALEIGAGMGDLGHLLSIQWWTLISKWIIQKLC